MSVAIRNRLESHSGKRKPCSFLTQRQLHTPNWFYSNGMVERAERDAVRGHPWTRGAEGERRDYQNSDTQRRGPYSPSQTTEASTAVWCQDLPGLAHVLLGFERARVGATTASRRWKQGGSPLPSSDLPWLEPNWRPASKEAWEM